MSPTRGETAGNVVSKFTAPTNAFANPGGQTLGVPTGPVGPVRPVSAIDARILGSLLTRVADDAVTANELVVGIPNGKNTATISPYNTIKLRLLVTIPAGPTGPTKFNATSATDAVEGVFPADVTILAENAKELLTALPNGINSMLMIISAEMCSFRSIADSATFVDIVQR
jgi:hypothetical protein